MDFKQLNYFVTTVEEGNISKAAQKLHISQPPLSKKLKDLEIELNVTLFERGSRKIELTQAGRLFYARAVSILELMEVSKQELQDYKYGKLGTLRLGIVSSISSTLTNQWFKEFHELYPEIHFNIFEGNTYEQLEKLRSNLIEIAIVRTPFSADDLDCTILKKEHLYAVGHARFFQQTTNEPLSLSQIYNQPLILYRRWEQPILSLCSELHLTPQIFCMNDDARTTVSMADSGLGIGIIPESATSLLSNPSTLKIPLSNEKLISSICLLQNPNSYHSTVVDIFSKFLKQFYNTFQAN